ncbi:MAG: RidA family protein [Paucibacter sp.]|nr:RidA family protein [Roseateles sp.]
MHIERHEIGPRFSEMTVVQVGEGKLIYIAGQVAENTSLDIGGQTREVLGFIDRLLAHVGARREHIVQARVYLASVGDYAQMNAVWEAWIPAGHTPARSTIGAKLINGAYKVEIEVTAAFTPSQEHGHAHDDGCVKEPTEHPHDHAR